MTVGRGSTVTVADWAALPPGPVQVRVKVDVVARAPVPAEPLVARAPVHAPLAVQDVSLVADHVNVDEPPAASEVGDALRLTVGGGSVPTWRISIAFTQASPAIVVNTRLSVASVVTVNVWSDTVLSGAEKFESTVVPSACTRNTRV